MIVDKINAYLSSNVKSIDEYLAYNVGQLATYAFKRQFLTEQEDTPKTLRLSSAGKCAKQLAYQYYGIERKGKEIDGRGKITFFQGDVVELTLLSLAKVAGCNLVATGLNQLILSLPIKINEQIININGHPDGVLFSDDIYLVECKSMSSYSFEDFEKGIISPEYLTQINLYMDCLGVNKCVFIALNKNNGVIHELIIKKDNNIVEEGKKNLLSVLTSTQEKLPEPKYQEVSDKGFYPWQCLYCGWWGLCKPEAEQKLVGKAYKLVKKNKGEIK